LATVNVTFEEPLPGAAIVAGENATVTPLGAPLAVSAIAELNPPETAAVSVVVAVTEPLLDVATATVAGEAVTVNAGFGAAVTVSDTAAVCVAPPPVPVRLIEYVPAAVVEATVNVTLELPEPGAAIVAGENATVTPLGAPVAVRATVELNPPETAVVTVVVAVTEPVAVSVTAKLVGEAVTVNAGVGAVVPPPVSAASRPLSGLPHPVTRSYPVVAE
jgi:hypothetical protein